MKLSDKAVIAFVCILASVFFLGIVLAPLIPLIIAANAPALDILNGQPYARTISGKTFLRTETVHNTSSIYDDKDHGSTAPDTYKEIYANWSYNISFTLIEKGQITDQTCHHVYGIETNPCVPPYYAYAAIVSKDGVQYTTWYFWQNQPSLDPEEKFLRNGFSINKIQYFVVDQDNFHIERGANIAINTIDTDIINALNYWCADVYQHSGLKALRP